MSTDTGSARPVITVERHEFRNRKTTSTVSSAPSTSASSTLRTELRTRSPASRTISSRVPGGSVFCSWAMRAFTQIGHRRRAVLARLHDVETDRLTTVEQRRRRRLGRARLDVRDLAERDRAARRAAR